MRLVVSVLIACASLGCRAPAQKATPPKALAPVHHITPQQLERAKQRIHLLRVDMTDEQVFDTLGIADCRFLASASGPFSYFSVWYPLGDGATLQIVRNLINPHESTLRNVSLNGVTWTPDEKH